MKTKITWEEWGIVLHAAYLRKGKNSERAGQAIFNTLEELHPDLAETIRATKYDMWESRQWMDNKIEGFIQQYVK